MKLRLLISTALLLHLTLQPAFSDDWPQRVTAALKNGGAYVEDSHGTVLYDHRGDDEFMPASTLKLATSACGLATLGADYRFRTQFFTDGEGVLYIKGSGDPGLVSEELTSIAEALARKIHAVRRIEVDDSLYAPGLVIDGSSNTTNPYDAPNGAFLVNFNTIAIEKSKGGVVTSGESQTPLTAMGRKLAATLPAGSHRINIGRDVSRGALYGAELLAAFLQKYGVTVKDAPRIGMVPKSARPIYEYVSGKSLQEVIQGLLKYSANYSANQVFLTMGLQQFGAPVTVEKGKRALTSCLADRFGWNNFNIEEGSGLSRKNKVTPKELVRLLRGFEPNRSLLPREEMFQAKTGTITGVNALAGYFDLPGRSSVRFAILINDDVPRDYRFEVAKMIYKGLGGN